MWLPKKYREWRTCLISGTTTCLVTSNCREMPCASGAMSKIPILHQRYYLSKNMYFTIFKCIERPCKCNVLMIHTYICAEITLLLFCFIYFRMKHKFMQAVSLFQKSDHEMLLNERMEYFRKPISISDYFSLFVCVELMFVHFIFIFYKYFRT